MSYTKDQKVQIVNLDTVRKDEHLEDSALKIIEKSNFRGKVTKIENGINFVGFKNELGWVTQGFKGNEIKGVE